MARAAAPSTTTYTDGTVAVDMEPLSLLSGLGTSVPPRRFHTVRYAGALAAASAWGPDIAPKPPTQEPTPATADPEPCEAGEPADTAPGRRSWRAPFVVDVLTCPNCEGRMRLLAVVKEPATMARYRAAVGEKSELPCRSLGRGLGVLEQPHPAPARCWGTGAREPPRG